MRKSSSHTGKPSSIVRKTKALHLIIKWNPSPLFESDTIAVHADILSKHSTVWAGKISKSGRIGVQEKDIAKLQDQINKGIETHLYLYCPDNSSPTLHVGLLTWLQKDIPNEIFQIPSYYFKLPYPVPFWFKLTDIRELSLEQYHHLVLVNDEPFDPVSANDYPMLVRERKNLPLFDYSYTNGAKWHVLQQLHLPGRSSHLVDPKFIFVLMPFSETFSDVWHLGIKPTIEGLGLSCKRADDFLHTRDIMDVVRENIRRSRLIIADMTTSNPNVFYELGYAHALGKPVILITQDRNVVPFDLRGLNNIEYKKIVDLNGPLAAMVKSVLGL